MAMFTARQQPDNISDLFAITLVSSSSIILPCSCVIDILRQISHQKRYRTELRNAHRLTASAHVYVGKQ